MIKKFLSKKENSYATVPFKKNFKENGADERFWVYCDKCNNHIFKKDLEDNLSMCPKCNKHYNLGARDRIKLLIDDTTFQEFDTSIEFDNILSFPDYSEKINKYQNNTKEKEAVITGKGCINGIDVVLCVMNPDFMMGSMGSVVGDKITSAIEYAIENKLPVIISCASGGARMQEGIISLMQMAKTSQALARLSQAGLIYISLLTNPTTGGVTASFAMLGDIIIAEPNALIAFAGPRVIKQTIKQDLPEGFQTSEFLLKHGFIDIVIGRNDMKSTLFKILEMHNPVDSEMENSYCEEGDLIACTEH